MVRHALIEQFEEIARPIVALGNDYPDGHAIAPHYHRRSQLLYGASGAVMVVTTQGTWVVPPQRGVWIPSGVEHKVRMLGDVSTHSLFLDATAAAGMPDHCQVVGISPFMRSLMAQAVELPVDYDPESRAGALMTLILHEMRQLPVLPLSLPFPAQDALARRCREFLVNPTPHETIDEWSAALGMSRRSFTRLFRQETGLSFATWRQQACLVAALPRLVAGEPVTAVALDLGYDNPAAFTTMFKRVLGSSPRNYLKQNG
ncbi:MAG TPA: helix-turn-helix transcriptional regulator [Alphaproteobacteria bacterium]|jgi:AraC-like DNA-binding protein/mannose-6-phosphate isomerase-like protein (cupin superfamily)